MECDALKYKFSVLDFWIHLPRAYIALTIFANWLYSAHNLDDGHKGYELVA